MLGSRPESADVSRRTWLAAERTWLAWWRTGVAAGAVAIAVGRLLPGFTRGARWPFALLGLGYGVLSVAVLLAGATRQRRTDSALQQGRYVDLSPALVSWLTAGAVALAMGAMVLVAIGL